MSRGIKISGVCGDGIGQTRGEMKTHAAAIITDVATIISCDDDDLTTTKRSAGSSDETMQRGRSTSQRARKTSLSAQLYRVAHNVNSYSQCLIRALVCVYNNSSEASLYIALCALARVHILSRVHTQIHALERIELAMTPLALVPDLCVDMFNDDDDERRRDAYTASRYKLFGVSDAALLSVCTAYTCTFILLIVFVLKLHCSSLRYCCACGGAGARAPFRAKLASKCREDEEPMPVLCSPNLARAYCHNHSDSYPSIPLGMKPRGERSSLAGRASAMGSSRPPASRSEWAATSHPRGCIDSYFGSRVSAGRRGVSSGNSIVIANKLFIFSLNRNGVLPPHQVINLSRSQNYRKKVINLTIIEEDSYEKDALFYVELGKPQLQGASGTRWLVRARLATHRSNYFESRAAQTVKHRYTQVMINNLEKRNNDRCRNLRGFILFSRSYFESRRLVGMKMTLKKILITSNEHEKCVYTKAIQLLLPRYTCSSPKKDLKFWIIARTNCRAREQHPHIYNPNHFADAAHGTQSFRPRDYQYIQQRHPGTELTERPDAQYKTHSETSHLMTFPLSGFEFICLNLLYARENTREFDTSASVVYLRLQDIDVYRGKISRGRVPQSIDFSVKECSNEDDDNFESRKSCCERFGERARLLCAQALEDTIGTRHINAGEKADYSKAKIFPANGRNALGRIKSRINITFSSAPDAAEVRFTTAEAGLAVAAEMKAPEDRTEEEKMALLGRPKLGEIFRAQIRIKESKEFKNTVDKLVQRANASIILGTSSWKEQFTEALTVSGGDDDEDGEESGDGAARQPSSPSVGDYLMHCLTIFWKVLFAFVPPTVIEKWLLAQEAGGIEHGSSCIYSDLNNRHIQLAQLSFAKYRWWLSLLRRQYRGHRRRYSHHWRRGVVFRLHPWDQRFRHCHTVCCTRHQHTSPRPDSGNECVSELVARTYNPFTKIHSSTCYTNAADLFPNKLRNLNGYRLKTALIPRPPAVNFARDNTTGRPIDITGTDIATMRIVAEFMNSSLQLVTPDITGYAQPINQSYHRSLLEEIVSGGLDLSGNQIFVMAGSDRERPGTTSISVWFDEFVALVPVYPSPVVHLKLGPFFIMLSTLGHVGFLYLFARLGHFEVRCWTWLQILQMLLGNASPKLPARFVERTMFFWIFLLSQVYSVTLYSQLTKFRLNERDEGPFETIDDILHFPNMSLETNLNYIKITFDNDDAELKALQKKVRVVENNMDCPVKILSEKNIGCLIDKSVAVNSIEVNDKTGVGPDKMKIMNHVFWSAPKGFIFFCQIPLSARIQ
ncbi:unnamed protein product [Trichogramma brassicae]|uniref:Uncharacterized protein n=1 Tax=Trichogramma brassicae TaxID=86971 RepID=A0A6H5IP89_9HYME|nr:unnamed protein product [Trichogramma brassicae]